MNIPTWHVFQIGFREKYAIPRALLRTGRNVNLVTDYWGRGPASDRYHPDLARHAVHSFNIISLWRDFFSQLMMKSDWEDIESRNQWFAARSARFITETAEPEDIVFSYSYGALEIFEEARKMGCRTILGQIDPGPEENRLVRELQRKNGVLHPAEPSDHYWQRWRRECELADIIMVNSDWSRRKIITAGVEERKIVTVPLAYEVSDPSKTASRENTFSTSSPLRVLFLGQLVVRKGILETIEAIAELESDAVHWTFVGNGPKDIVSRLKAMPNVEVIGKVRHHDVARYYQAADVFFLPTHSDGFAITQLEAMSYGLPVVASSHCGQVVEHGKTGLILESVTKDSIVGAIRHLINEPEQIAEMIEAIGSSEYLWTLDTLSENLLQLEQEIETVVANE